jgi:hypothetical protein
MSNDAISLGRWREPVDPFSPEQDAAGRAAAATISLVVAKQKLARLPTPKQLDERVIALEQQIDALIAGLEAIDPGGDEVKTQLAYKVTHLIEQQLNLIAQRVERLEMEDVIRLSDIVREQAVEDYKKATE